MGVDFGGFDAAVAQQILDDAGVGAGFHEVGGVGVAQHMQRDGPQDARPAGGLLHDQLQAALAVGFAGVLALEEEDDGAKRSELLAEQQQQRFGQGQVAVLFAFAAAHVQGHAFAVDVGGSEGQHFA